MTIAPPERASRSGGQRWPIVAAILIWSAFSFAILFFDPGSEAYFRILNQPPFTCMRLVGRSAACKEAVIAANAAWVWIHQYPLLLSVAAGYVAIVVIAIRGRPSRHT